VNNVKQSALDKLNQLRELDGKAMVLNCAYRCPAHNAEVGGAKRSQHMDGIAFDIRLDGRDPRQLAAMARSIGFNGIGYYKTFLHVDMRLIPAEWHG
jgi:uncharacterized protein YcbK (DUF882 family)